MELSSSSGVVAVELMSKTVESVTTDKEHVNVVFIGHVDAGKSTIGGQMMFLTGMVDKRTLEKYEKEAKEKNRETWYLSWCMDTNSEEREKGKTVSLPSMGFPRASTTRPRTSIPTGTSTIAPVLFTTS